MKKDTSTPPAQNFLSTGEIATLLGVSRIAIFKRIKTGSLRAVKVGRNYIIHLDDLEKATGIKFVKNR